MSSKVNDRRPSPIRISSNEKGEAKGEERKKKGEEEEKDPECFMLRAQY